MFTPECQWLFANAVLIIHSTCSARTTFPCSIHAIFAPLFSRQPASLSLRFASALSLWISRVHFILLRIYHKGTSDDKFHMTTTRLLWTRLENLSPNSQYVVYVVAIAPRGASLPSETLVAWTEPALSAFVDVSSVWCARLVTCHDNVRRRRAASVKLVFHVK